jgi:hypothetical protein
MKPKEKHVKKCSLIFLKLPLIIGLLWGHQRFPITRELNAAVPTQAATFTPLRLGDLARALSEQDLANIERALPAGDKPWLLIGDRGQGGSKIQFIEAYMPPETTSPEMRRGRMIRLIRRVSDSPTPESWTINNNFQQGQGMSGTYAQVVVAGRGFEQIQSDQDINRPFFVTGRFDDAELFSLVTFLRPNSGDPIQYVVRQSDDAVAVGIRETSTTSRVLTIRKQGQGWIIVGTAHGMA